MEVLVFLLNFLLKSFKYHYTIEEETVKRIYVSASFYLRLFNVIANRYFLSLEIFDHILCLPTGVFWSNADLFTIKSICFYIQQYKKCALYST